MWEEQMAVKVLPRVEHQDECHVVWNLLQAGPVVASLFLVLWGMCIQSCSTQIGVVISKNTNQPFITPPVLFKLLLKSKEL